MATYAQLAGALMVLAAFVLIQRSIVEPRSLVALWLNAVGAATLTAVAFAGSQWWFFVLNIVWSFVAVFGLIDRARKGKPSAIAVPETDQKP